VGSGEEGEEANAKETCRFPINVSLFPLSISLAGRSDLGFFVVSSGGVVLLVCLLIRYTPELGYMVSEGFFFFFIAIGPLYITRYRIRLRDVLHCSG